MCVKNEIASVFAFWTEIPTNVATSDPLNPFQLRRYVDTEMDARLFIVGIPEGTSRHEAKEFGGRYVDSSCDHAGEILKCGFPEQWPIDIRAEFRDAHSRVTKLLWSHTAGE